MYTLPSPAGQRRYFGGPIPSWIAGPGPTNVGVSPSPVVIPIASVIGGLLAGGAAWGFTLTYCDKMESEGKWLSLGTSLVAGAALSSLTMITAQLLAH